MVRKVLRDRPAQRAATDEIEARAFQLRRRGWTAADIEKEVGITYAQARRYVRRFDAIHGRPAKTIRNARKTPQQASIREVRQNLSALLKRVQAGETLEVIERGRPVALLVPKPENDSAFERLIASGRIRRPTGRLDELGPAPRLQLPVSLSRALQELREERL